MIEKYNEYIARLFCKLCYIELSDMHTRISFETGVSEFFSMIKNIKDNNSCIFCIGNGASASLASHFATDVMKNMGIKAITFNDISLLTSLGNDNSFEEIFSFPLSRLSQNRDILLAISASGNSLNIINAVTIARKLGMTIITLTGLSPDNKLRLLGDLNIYVPCSTYGTVESAHAVILHFLIDIFLESGL